MKAAPLSPPTGAVTYPKAEGCDTALNRYCESNCKVCPGVTKYARYSTAFWEQNVDKWRCYCDYTLSEDLSEYSIEKYEAGKQAGEMQFKNFCTRDKGLRDVLQQCRDGVITKDGNEVKEL